MRLQGTLDMQDFVFELPRISLPRTPVNKALLDCLPTLRSRIGTQTNQAMRWHVGSSNRVLAQEFLPLLPQPHSIGLPSSKRYEERYEVEGRTNLEPRYIRSSGPAKSYSSAITLGQRGTEAES